jgi:hypothetical protein
MTSFKVLTTVIHILLLAVIILIILTGFGITDYHVIQAITFGGLSKALSFQLHTLLVWPLIILIGAHIVLVLWKHHASKQ